jgi:hypothetical protein
MTVFTHWPEGRQGLNYFYIADHFNWRFMISPVSGLNWFFRLPGGQGLIFDFNLGPDEYDDLLWQFGPFHLVREGFPPEDEY